MMSLGRYAAEDFPLLDLAPIYNSRCLRLATDGSRRVPPRRSFSGGDSDRVHALSFIHSRARCSLLRFRRRLIIGFVEKFYFTLRHGLQATYKSGTQRLAAMLSYRALQITIALNAAVLCAWITGESMPPLLERWNRYSIVLHFIIALLGVTAVRDTDAVATHRRLELKAETARRDLVTLRKAAMLGNPLALVAAKLRGFLDGVRLARELIVDKPGRSSSARPSQADGLTYIDGWSGLYLPGEFRAEPADNVTDIAGKLRRR